MSESKQQRLLGAWQTFLNTSLERRIQHIVETDAQAAVLELFHSVAANVPAYQKFLTEQEIDPQAINSWNDFQSLPLTTKTNYIQRYPLAQLCRDGQLETCDWIAVSSGSTGKPTFWPRFMTDEFQIANRFEQIFRDFHADTRRSLTVVCFALGTWVGGMYTASCCRYLAAKGYPITVVTPGNNKAEILRVVQELAPLFEQVILLGYPPFLKEVIDSGSAAGIEWQRYAIKLVMAGEVFSEEWRSLVGNRVGSSHPCYDSASLYGTADAGVLGNETPLSICIRRFLAEHPDASRALFGESRLPTLVQYDPTSRFFEVQDGTLLFSGDNGIPLIRYHISDLGGIVAYEAMIEFFASLGIRSLTALQAQDNRGIYPSFVYIFGRSHFTVSYFGANIYPENVSVGLEQPEIQAWVTGKFVIGIEEDADKNPLLAIVVELASGVEVCEEKQLKIAQSIQTQLLRLNSEFANYVPSNAQSPQVLLVNLGDPNYFPVGIKHRYTRH